MPDYYYTPNPQSAHKPITVPYVYRGHNLCFETDSGVFSRTEIDRGTEILLNALPATLSGEVLDMGCGYGAIGVSVGKCWPECAVTMADVNERACELARENAKRSGVRAEVLVSDGYAQIPDTRYAWILQNPPIRAGKAVIYRMFAQAANRLAQGGSLWLVIRKQQGAPSALSYLQTLFQEVRIVDKESGYWIFCCSAPLETGGEQQTTHSDGETRL